MPTVLIVEDDGVIARSISMHLRHAGFDVEWAESGDRGLKKLRFERPDVVLVDLMLPGLDGWAFTEIARREGMSVPIVVISARASEHDKVHALEIGADDYLSKPFGMRELVARVQVALRRSRIEPMQTREPIEAPGLVDRLGPAARVPARPTRAGSTPSSPRPSSGCSGCWPRTAAG